MNTNFIAIPFEGYNEMLGKLGLLDEIMELMRQYQFEERTNPGPDYMHNNRCRLLVHDIEWLLKKELGPTVEECPYAE